MNAQATKVDIALAKNKVDRPVFAGYKDVSILKENLKKNNIQILVADEVRARASSHNNSSRGNSARALTEIGDLHFNKGSYARASQAYIKALKIDDDNIPTFEKLIQSLVVSRKYDEAEKFYQNFLANVKHHPRYVNQYLIFRIMVALGDENQVGKTISVFESYQNINDDSVLNTIGLFHVLIKKEFETARDYFKKSLAVNADNIDANNNLGVSLRNERKFELAEKYLHKAHFLNLKYVAAYENLAGLYFMKDNLKKAISILENAAVNHVEISDVWQHNLAMFYFQVENFEMSIKKYKELSDAEPDNNLVLNNIGASYEKLSKIKTANTFFTRSIEVVRRLHKSKEQLDPRGANAFINAARLLVKSGKDTDALSFTKEARKYFPNNNEIYHLESIIYIARGDFERAKEKLLISLDLNPSYVDSIADLSYIYEDIELNFQAAIEILEPLELGHETELDKILINNLAYAYLKTGQIKKAEKLFLDDDEVFATLATRGFYYILKDDLVNAKKWYDKAYDAATGSNKDKVRQYYFYELMEYWIKQGDLENALLNANKSQEYVVNHSIESLVSKFLGSQE